MYPAFVDKARWFEKSEQQLSDQTQASRYATSKPPVRSVVGQSLVSFLAW